MNASDSLDVLWGYQNQYFSRGAHIEQLLLGLFTVAVVGWAFLHAREKGPSEGKPLLARLLFTAVFSMLVAASYNVVYIMMISNDLTILDLENRVLSNVKPFRYYYNQLGSLKVDLYVITGIVVPVLAMASQVSVFFDRTRLQTRSHQWLVGAMTVLFGLVVLYTTARNAFFWGKLFRVLEPGG